jgi:segregation and condensation protein A
VFSPHPHPLSLGRGVSEGRGGGTKIDISCWSGILQDWIKFAPRFPRFSTISMTSHDNFEVKLSLFEGPFDLLLFFIERDELDIYDIPISKITNDFLEYLHQLEELNVDIASEFILVAATLMRIKSKMLLPRPQLDEQGNEIDPREELVKHLLEYKKYKSVIESFHKMEEIELMKEKRGNLMKELRTLAESSNVEAELQDVDLFKLMNVFEKVLKRFEADKNKPVHQIIQYPYTVENQKEYLMNEVIAKQRVSFIDIVETYKTRIALIFNFLAILDLLAQGELSIQVGEGYNNFWIMRGTEIGNIQETSSL